MELDEIVAMAVAVVAEEMGTDIKKVKVISFNEVSDAQEDTE